MIAEAIFDLLPGDWPKVIGDLPAARSRTIGIVEYDGATSTEYFGPQDSSSIVSPIVKIIIRAKSYEEGQAWANQAKSILHRYHDDTFLSILMVSAPMYLGRTPEKLHEFQVTFKTQVKE